MCPRNTLNTRNQVNSTELIYKEESYKIIDAGFGVRLMVGEESSLLLGSTPAPPDQIGTSRGSLCVLHEGVENCDRGGRDPQDWLTHF